MRYAPEVRERAVRMVSELEATHVSRRAAIKSIAPKIGCSPETLRRWVRQLEDDSGVRERLTTSIRERLEALESEIHELKRANDLLHKESVAPAQAERGREATTLYFSSDQLDIAITLKPRTDGDGYDLLGRILEIAGVDPKEYGIQLAGENDFFRQAYCDEKSRFSFYRLPTGKYRMTVTGPGFEITPPVVKCGF